MLVNDINNTPEHKRMIAFRLYNYMILLNINRLCSHQKYSQGRFSCFACLKSKLHVDRPTIFNEARKILGQIFDLFLSTDWN